MNIDLTKTRERYGDLGVRAALDMYSMMNKELLTWLASLWDGETGGFYYATSSRVTDGYLPDAESTRQAVEMLEFLGVVPTYTELPENMKRKIGEFAQRMQDESDGYFYHLQWKEMMLLEPERFNSRRGRDLGHCVMLIRRLAGMEPKYPTAYDRIKKTNSDDGSREGVPPHLRSREAFAKYLDELNINEGSSYAKGHLLSSQASQIIAAGLKDMCVEYLTARQNKENGTWETEVNIGSVNGVTKIGTAYYYLGAAIPNALLAFRSALEVALRDEEGVAVTHAYNPIFTVEVMMNDMKRMGMQEEYSEARRMLFDSGAELIRITAKKLRPYYKEHEAAFSYCRDCSSWISQNAPASLGLKEADVNATQLATDTVRRLFHILELDVGYPCNSIEDKSYFLEMIGEK